MKFYIVTKGSYSDYHIKRVFLQKEKAEIYRNIINSDNDIEEYDTSDGEIGKSIADELNKIKPIWDFRCEYFPRDNIFNILYIQASTAESYSGNETSYYNGVYKLISFTRSLPRKEDEEKDEVEAKIYDKMKKISQDLWAIIQEQLANGATNEEINKMLNAKSEE